MVLRVRRRLRDEGGFSVVELIIYFIVATVVIAAVYQLLIGQNRLYMKQRELQDVRGTLRAAANLLAFEFRQASASGGDLYSIDTYTFAVRSLQATGIVCGVKKVEKRYALYAKNGEFAQNDSMLLFAANGSGPSDDAWVPTLIKKIWDPSGGGLPYCQWGDSSTVATESLLEIDTVGVSLDGVKVGAPVRTFHRVEYGLYSQDGRWWLGRKVSGAGSYEQLIGPLRAPSDSGLALVYYDADGNVLDPPAGNEAQVSYVDIVLRGESYGSVPKPGAAPAAQQDTLTLRVSLRG